MPPRRIVSLCPSITETLIDFGLTDHIVGVTRFCIHPANAVQGLKKVGGTKDPDIDAILAAKPDLVLMNAEENRKEDHDILAGAVPVDVSEPRRVRDVPALLRHLSAVTGSAQGQARAQELEDALDRLAEARAQAPERKFTFAYMIWKNPWMTVSASTYVDDLLSLAGGENIFADADTRYPTVTLEDIQRLTPTRVFLADEPFPFKASHAREVSAQTQTEVEVISGDDCCWHGVRSIRGARLAAELFSRLARPVQMRLPNSDRRA
jgi:iron complex transport system substrate-binding protein